MTVEIDDSGTGDLLGPAFIGFWRRETNDLRIIQIPLQLYQQPNYNVLTRKFIKDQFIDALKSLEITKTEDIHICRGNCFREARKYLLTEGYNLYKAKIAGYLQDKIEMTYLNYLVAEYGFPRRKISKVSGKDRYFDQFHWVTADFPHREQWVKTGFPSWHNKWRKKAITEWQTRQTNN